MHNASVVPETCEARGARVLGIVIDQLNSLDADELKCVLAAAQAFFGIEEGSDKDR